MSDEIEKNAISEEKPKRRGRPRKTETAAANNVPVSSEEAPAASSQEETPKKKRTASTRRTAKAASAKETTASSAAARDLSNSANDNNPGQAALSADEAAGHPSSAVAEPTEQATASGSTAPSTEETHRQLSSSSEDSARKSTGRKTIVRRTRTALSQETVRTGEEPALAKGEGEGAVSEAPETGSVRAENGARTEAAPARTADTEGATPHDPDAKPVHGILEVMQEGYGFIRSENFLPGEHDVYVNPQMIRRYNLKTGDMLQGFSKSRNPQERYSALMFIETVNGLPLFRIIRRVPFERLTPIFPNERLRLEVPGEKAPTALRVLDLLSPIGKGQRGMIVSPPKAGKTTLLKQVAKAIVKNEPKMHLLILLIDERPEEVTDMKAEVEGGLVQVIYSTFDETPDNHKRVAEMTIERAKRLVEQGEDVTILLDSITRLARAYNLTVQASGRTLSGGLDPAALHPPKKFFGAARNMKEYGSLTILATALVDTGSRMDDVIYEEFKGTGNMELVLNRELQERRIFPAIDILKSGTRRDDLLLTELEQRAADIIHRETIGEDKKSGIEDILNLFARTQNNQEVCEFLVNKKAIPAPNPSGRLIKVNKRTER